MGQSAVLEASKEGAVGKVGVRGLNQGELSSVVQAEHFLRKCEAQLPEISCKETLSAQGTGHVRHRACEAQGVQGHRACV